MAREFGKLWFSMFTDEDFARQPVGDKYLYQTLLGQPSMNYAGVQAINMRRLRKANRDGDVLPSEAEIEKRLIRLEERGFVFTDDETGELLVRSFMRVDGIIEQPNVLKSALRQAAQVESPKIAAVLLSEIERLGEPKLKAETEAAMRLRASIGELRAAAVNHLETLAEGLSKPFPKPFAEGMPEPLPEGLPRPGETEPFAEPFQEALADGSVEVVVGVEVEESPTRDGYVGVRARADENGQPQPRQPQIGPTSNPAQPANDAEPPSRCVKHRAVPADGPCGPCANFRKAHDRWAERQRRREAEAQSAEARRAAATRRAAIAACPLGCGDTDPIGYLDGRVCSHDPDEAERAARGLEACRAALAKPGPDAQASSEAGEA